MMRENQQKMQTIHKDNDGNILEVSPQWAAIVRYCRYQERCHAEVRNKLSELGCYATEADELISRLISDDILSEERFARLYAGGKFRIKQWGKEKIRNELKQRRISDYCIRKGLAEIDAEDYDKTLEKLTHKKIAELKSEKNQFVKQQKVYRYLVQKGYERDLALEAIKAGMKK